MKLSYILLQNWEMCLLHQNIFYMMSLYLTQFIQTKKKFFEPLLQSNWMAIFSSGILFELL
jgi:hypothetical protein